ncbi:unnamed protein product [marine sediment metagenome]|uniref:Peptidase S26 domain-containing protein n=1 Tax=marine sediment metagenome TaxID=412755 RepID=X0UFV2_9ZZZZ
MTMRIKKRKPIIAALLSSTVPGPGQAYINDKPIIEDYKIHLDSMVFSKKDDSPYYDSMRDNFGPEHVPSDHCFVLGDNRDRSLDSRHWDYLPLHNIKGKTAYVYWSKDILRIGMKLK